MAAGFPFAPTLDDGSSQYFWEHDGWEAIPPNLNQSEPVVTLIHGLHALNPKAKVIIMLRDPVDR